MRFILAGAVSLALLAGCSEAQRPGDDLAGKWESGPSGVYYMQMYSVVARSLERHIYLFAGDRFVQDPEGDIATVDIDSAKPAWRGTWSYASGTLTMTFAAGRVDTGEVTPDSDGCFQFIDGIWCPALPFAGSAIDGTYSGGSSFQSSHTATDYDFAPDGSYTVLSGASVATGDTGSDSRVTAAGAATGRYQIDGLTLTLTAADGAQTRGVAFPFGTSADAARPDYIYFNGLLMKRTGD